MKHELLNIPSSHKGALRLRKTAAVRSLVQETILRREHLIQPIFVTEGATKVMEHIPGLSCYQLSDLLKEVESVMMSGVMAVTLFCHAGDPSSLLARALKALKSSFPELLVIADISLDSFNDHSRERGSLFKTLAKTALTACGAGADFIAPSGLVDGRLGDVRKCLDEHDYSSVGLISYAAKYASSLYVPSFAHVKEENYYVNPANRREAIHECLLDEKEGADLLLIKPALTSLDIITTLKTASLLPIGAYHSSGEWAMLQAAAQQGWIDRDKVLLESLLAIRRAGADCIFCYGAKEAAKLI